MPSQRLRQYSVQEVLHNRQQWIVGLATGCALSCDWQSHPDCLSDVHNSAWLDC